jgi:hypothetical protein
MSLSRLEADQLYTWSDTYAAPVPQTILARFAKTSPTAPAPAATARSLAAWLTHRALQALRQARMQVCQQCWPWSQVLSLGELSQTATANGLRAAGAAGASSQVAGPLPPGARDLGRDLQDQPRTVAPPRGALKGRDERYIFHRLGSAGYAIRRRAPGQHAGRLAGERVKLFGNRRGRR